MSPCPVDIKKEDNEGLAHINSAVAKFLGGPFEFMTSPVIKGLTSKSGVWQWTTSHLFDHELAIKKNLKDVATQGSLEGRINLSTQSMRKASVDVRKLYREAVGVKGVGADIKAVIKSRTGKDRVLTYNEFEERVAKAMRRNDIDPGGLPQVSKAAKLLRKEIDKATKELQTRQLLPESLNTKTAASYLSRRYNRHAILTNLEEFKDVLRRHFRATTKDAAELEKAVTETTNRLTDVGDETLEISGLIDRVLKGDRSPSILKDRTLNIPDEDLEKFLHNDATTVTSGFINQAYGIVHTVDKFKEMGVSGVEDVLKMARDDYLDLISKAKSKKAVEKLVAEEHRALQSIRDGFDMVNGRYGTRNHPFLQRLRKLNAMAMLGGIMVSSIPDLAMNVFKHGFGATWQDGLSILPKKIKAFKGQSDELADMGFYMEAEANTILKAQMDPDFRHGTLTNTPVDRAIEATSRFFSQTTGINVWNKMVARMGARINMARLVRNFKNVKEGGKLSQKEAQRLNRLGIGTDQHKVILRNLKHAEEIDGAVIAHPQKWDAEGQELLSNMILRDQTVLKPGKGDIPPFFQETDIGITLFQFKSFMITATNRILIPGVQRTTGNIQQRGMAGVFDNELQGVMSLISLGASVYAIKQKLRGEKIDTDIDRLIYEGMSRSGVLGLIGETAALLPFVPRSSRFAGLNAQGFLGSPSLIQVAKLVENMHGYADGDISDSDLKKSAKFLPFNNLFYLQGLLKGLNK